MLEAIAVLVTLGIFAVGTRLTWLALLDRPITPRTLVGLPRRRPSALAKTVDRMPEPDEHAERPRGIGSF
ncbi:MAG TPA: hypothetical protein VF406_00105 [Thermodesulfobacteriota bacterium]